MSVKVFAPNQSVQDSDGTLIYGLMVRRVIRQDTVTVGNTATKIPTSPLSKRLSILIMNIGTEVVYIGDATVTAINGFPLYPRGTLRLDIEDSIDVYGIATTSAECRILEGG